MEPNAYVRMSLYYFLYFSAAAVFAPYFNLYLTTRGLDSSQVGAVLATMPLVGLVAQPLWGILNDWFHWKKAMVYAALIVCPSMVAIFPSLHHFLGFLVTAALLAVFQTAIIPVMDGLTVETAGVRNYGKIRLFGSLGYAMLVAVAGRLYRSGELDRMIPLYALCCAVALAGLFLYPKPALGATSRLRTQSPFAGTRKLLRNRHFVLLLALTLLVSISQWVNNSFFTLYYHDLNRPLGLLGFIYGAGALSELPFFFLSGRWIERYGAERILLISSGVFCFRWVLLSFGPPTWVLLCLQLLNGVSFGLGFAAGVAVAARCSDQTNQMTAQTLYSAINTGLAAIVGSLVGGVVLQGYGPHMLYGFAALISTVGALGMSFLLSAMHRRKPATEGVTHTV